MVNLPEKVKIAIPQLSSEERVQDNYLKVKADETHIIIAIPINKKDIEIRE